MSFSKANGRVAFHLHLSKNWSYIRVRRTSDPKNNISRIFHPHKIFLKTTTSLDGSYESDIYTTFVNKVVISYQMLEF